MILNFECSILIGLSITQLSSVIEKPMRVLLKIAYISLQKPTLHPSKVGLSPGVRDVAHSVVFNII
jgi:hypothetical protein